MKAFCFFEQSGTFKHAFMQNGVQAEDFDIRNDFGETDHAIDLFKEIEKGYAGAPSVFDRVSPDDISFAFFPCVRFCSQIDMYFRGESPGQRRWDVVKKCEYAIKLEQERADLYILFHKLISIYTTRGLKLVIENPATKPHYLTTYSPIKPTIIDQDRSADGDFYRKPTQFFFIGFEPSNNPLPHIVESGRKAARVNYILADEHYVVRGGDARKVSRSAISGMYADRFIKRYIL